MFGVRAGAYRTQWCETGVYAAYRTNYRDIVVGVDPGGDEHLLATLGQVVRSDAAFTARAIATRAIVAFGNAPDALTMGQLLDTVPCVRTGMPR